MDDIVQESLPQVREHCLYNRDTHGEHFHRAESSAVLVFLSSFRFKIIAKIAQAGLQWLSSNTGSQRRVTYCRALLRCLCPNQGSLVSDIHHTWVRGADLTILFARIRGLKGLGGRIEILAMGITGAHSDCSVSIVLVWFDTWFVGLLLQECNIQIWWTIALIRSSQLLSYLFFLVQIESRESSSSCVIFYTLFCFHLFLLGVILRWHITAAWSDYVNAAL